MPAPALDPVPPVTGGLLPAAARLVGARPGDTVLVRTGREDVVQLLTRTAARGPDDVVVVGPAAPGTRSGDAVRQVALAATLAGTVAAVTDELAGRAAELLVVPGVHPVTGNLLPLAHLADVAHAHGARIAVEAGALVATGAVDMTAADLDHVVFDALDVHAPLAATVLVGRPGPAGHSAPPPPRRAVSAALAAACREVGQLPDGLLAAHEADLRRRVVATLAALPGVHAVGGWPDAPRHAGLVSFTVDGFEAAAVAGHLAVRHGLAGVDTVALPTVSSRPGPAAVRLRLDAAWAAEDVDRLREALEDVLTG